MSFTGKILSKLGPSEASGLRLAYYQSHLSDLYDSVSSHPTSVAHLTAGNVSYLESGLAQKTEVGAFRLSPVDFCRLFMVFNNARAGERTKVWTSRFSKRKSLEAPLGVYVISSVSNLTHEQVRIGLFKKSPFDLFGQSLYMDHLRLNEEVSPPLLGTIAVSLSLMTAFRVGIRSVRLFGAGGYNRFNGGRKKTKYWGYKVCPKFGFDAPLFREEMRDPDFLGCKTVSDVVKKDPNLWSEVGFERMMEFDMNPNSQSWKTLIAYLRGKGF
ncbi:hypothetical protein ACM9XD_17265 [Xanthomonas sacchari]